MFRPQQIIHFYLTSIYFFSPMDDISKILFVHLSNIVIRCLRDHMTLVTHLDLDEAVSSSSPITSEFGTLLT